MYLGLVAAVSGDFPRPDGGVLGVGIPDSAQQPSPPLLSGFALTLPVLLAEGVRPGKLDSEQNGAEPITMAAMVAFQALSGTGSLRGEA